MRCRGLVVMTVTVASVLACDDGSSGGASAPPPPVAARPRVVPDAGAATVEAITEAYQYVYSPVGKRDPFRAMSVGANETGAGSMASGQSPCDEVLCQFDLDDLKLVAVVSGDANPLAMVEDRNGVGHVLRRNTKVGRQAGKVTAILRDCVVVTSFVAGPDGRQQPNRQSLCVSPEGGAAPVLDLLNGKQRE